MNNLAQIVTTLWAGIVIGGSLIAAPAKFQAPSLELPVALEVGRAQFLWVGYAEAICATVLIVLLFKSVQSGILTSPFFNATLGAIALLAAQRLVVMPLLNDRTDAIVSGAAVPPSHLHLVFVVLEVLKLVLLLVASWYVIRKEVPHVAL